MNTYPSFAGYGKQLANSKPVLIAFSHICGSDFITGAEKLLLFMLQELQSSYECRLVVPEEGILARKARKSGIQVILLPIPITPALYLAGPSASQEAETLKHHPAWPATISLLQSHGPQLVLVSTCVHPLPAMAAKHSAFRRSGRLWRQLRSQNILHTPPLSFISMPTGS